METERNGSEASAMVLAVSAAGKLLQFLDRFAPPPPPPAPASAADASDAAAAESTELPGVVQRKDDDESAVWSVVRMNRFELSLLSAHAITLQDSLAALGMSGVYDATERTLALLWKRGDGSCMVKSGWKTKAA